MEPLYSDNDITITETTITTASGKILQLKVLSDVAIGQELTRKGKLAKKLIYFGCVLIGIVSLILWLELGSDGKEEISPMEWVLISPLFLGGFLISAATFLEDYEHKGDMTTLLAKIGYTDEQVLLRSTDGEHIRSLETIIRQQLREMQTETSSESLVASLAHHSHRHPRVR